jgi:methylglutaconyl-CoA hydratase
MAILRRSVSERRAFDLLATGAVIGAQKAAEIGLINRVFADGALEAEVERFIVELASRSASALSLMKSLLYQTDGISFEAAISAGAQTNTIARLTEDCRRGVEEFLKKR